MLQMSYDPRVEIAAFLAQTGVIPAAWQPHSAVLETSIHKAGIIPVLPAATIENWQLYVMCPRAERPELGPPPFQLCKGTRMTWENGYWRDLTPEEVAGEDAEPLAATALREGIEEIGLKLTNITSLADMGVHAFTSASTAKTKWLQLFVAYVADEADFLPDTEIMPTTDKRGWMRFGDFLRYGRVDHIVCVESVLERLQDGIQA